MKISSQAMNRLLSINWFYSVGKEVNVPNSILVKNSADANECISSPEWEDVTLQESNKISGFLAQKYSDIYQYWNVIAIDAKSFINNEIIKNFSDIDGVDPILLSQCVRWDLMHYLIEDTYKEKLTRPLFFAGLVDIYERGYLPCGWDGEWPNGNLIVY
ncbi:hypothetical protein L7G72_06770 [Xenorhabdus bovienii]|uniref:hypothetical protein n=1 Tax=Xenorhabdus bovienii TaxID=40576 RepID=UPI001EDF0DB3|nr:hypothetical protein [Xenorhabdus bovienii]MCG3461560.1 hypothetical protein [Xenorhabdus bovienii]